MNFRLGHKLVGVCLVSEQRSAIKYEVILVAVPYLKVYTERKKWKKTLPCSAKGKNIKEYSI